MIEVILSGLVIGLLGGFHCMGMCGPLALALPLNTTHTTQRITALLAYHFGRITVYASLGFGIGLLGQSTALWGIQRQLSIVSGLLILAFVVLQYTSFFKGFSWFKTYQSSIQTLLNRYWKKEKTAPTLMVMGALNGLLPCGLVYVALASALATPSPQASTLLMAGFGLGTLPFLMSLSLLSQVFTPVVRQKISRFIPIILIITGSLLVVRGLDLGIPYLSPKQTVEQDGSVEHECCHKK